jgi:hypothetical protein
VRARAWARLSALDNPGPERQMRTHLLLRALPGADGTIVAARHHRLAVGADAQGPHFGMVPGQRQDLFEFVAVLRGAAALTLVLAQRQACLCARTQYLTILSLPTLKK